MVVAGIDCGAKYTKAVLFKSGRILSKGMAQTGFDQQKAIAESLEVALNGVGMNRSDIQRVFGTGSLDQVIGPIDDLVNDRRALVQGTRYFFPKAGTVADIGAEESRIVRIDGKGGIVDFSINEKCAAGTGSFIEAMARALEIPIEEMGPLSLTSDGNISLNAQCTIFAESEVIGLIHAGIPQRDICEAIHDATASRIAAMIQRIGITEDVVLMGGVACNLGFVSAVKRRLKLQNIYTPAYPEYGTALGAAVLAIDTC